MMLLRFSDYIQFSNNQHQQLTLITKNYNRYIDLKSIHKMSSSSCNEQSHLLLKQQVFDLTHQLELVKIQNENLLREIAELKEKENQLKNINQLIIHNLNTKDQKINNQITLKIEGEFLNKRIQQLQQQLEKYRSGVSDSVDRRVKKIVTELNQQQELQNHKKNSRKSVSPSFNKKNSQKEYYETHQHKYYNIEYNNYINPNGESTQNTDAPSYKHQAHKAKNIVVNEQEDTESVCVPYNINMLNKTQCQRCLELQEAMAQKDQYIHQLIEQLQFYANKAKRDSESYIQSVINDNSSQIQSWKAKYLQMLKLYQNLKQQHQQMLEQLQTQSNDRESTYTILQSPIQGFGKKQQFHLNLNKNPTESRLYREDSDRQSSMMQEITNLVNGMGRNKKNNMEKDKEKMGFYQQREKSNVYVGDRSVNNMEKKSRVSFTGNNTSRITVNNGASRVSTVGNKLDGSVFTIKQGVNRHGGNNLFF